MVEGMKHEIVFTQDRAQAEPENDACPVCGSPLNDYSGACEDLGDNGCMYFE